jgi:hypothetical protein
MSETLRTQKEIQYQTLSAVLKRAFERASEGKGHKQHGSPEPFEQQRIIADCLAMNDTKGHALTAQIMKKAQEAHRGRGRVGATNELLDVIVYAAARIILLEMNR